MKLLGRFVVLVLGVFDHLHKNYVKSLFFTNKSRSNTALCGNYGNLLLTKKYFVKSTLLFFSKNVGFTEVLSKKPESEELFPITFFCTNSEKIS